MPFGSQPAPKVQFLDVQFLDQELVAQEKNFADRPFTTGLSPQDIFLLAKVDCEPYQIVVGSIVYSMGLRGVVRSVMRAFSRGEMADFSHLQRVARDLAIARMRGRAEEIGASGVIAVRIEAIHHADFLEVVATGTAIRPIGRGLKPLGGGELPEVVVGT